MVFTCGLTTWHARASLFPRGYWGRAHVAEAEAFELQFEKRRVAGPVSGTGG